jgi:hypothetical protein
MLALLIAQDIALGMILAFLPALTQPETVGLTLITALGKFVLFVGGAIALGRWCVPWLIRTVAATESQELFLLTVIESVRDMKVHDFNPTEDFIKEIMDSLHSEQGHLLARNWNLPEAYCTVTRDHHKEPFDSRNALLLLVRMAEKPHSR